MKEVVGELLLATHQLPRETLIFSALILALTVLFHLRYSHPAVQVGPTILTTTGIFATFVAIALGLSQFDSADVVGSVPALLGSLKTAFWASVVGVGGALTLKIRDYVSSLSVSKERGHVKGATVDDLVGILHEIQWSISGSDERSLLGQTRLARQEICEILNRIQKGISGDDEGSLLSQTKLSRQDVNDRLHDLQRAQSQALEKLAEMGSKALIEGLRDVIRDFNSRITEQFGDNFKQLNQAVGQLLAWQENYKLTIASTIEQLDKVSQSAEKVVDKFETTVSLASEFARTATGLQELLTGLETQKDQLELTARNLAELFKSAGESIPQVENRLEAIALQLARAFEQNQAQLVNALKEGQKQLNALLTESMGLVSNAAETCKALTTALSEAQSESNKQIVELVAKTKEQVTILDRALTEELTKSLESLGRQLAVLSEKFVEDYTPLTERLRDVVRITKGLTH